MYKQKLNELCQKKKWATPTYEKRSEGPDHSPMFHASVRVNGRTFDGPKEKLFTTLKEAQNEAARLAVNFFISDANIGISSDLKNDAPGSSSSGTIRTETGESFKTQLQTYTDEKFWEIPVYVHECLTFDNSSSFKAPVNVEIQTSECQNDAERDIAGLATAIFANLEDENKSYKILLSEMAQKKGLAGPTYQTLSKGPHHEQTFISTIEFGGESFQGDLMKKKKQAENSAAKVAWMKLKEEKLPRIPSGLTSIFRSITIEDVPPSGKVNTSHQSSASVSGSSEQTTEISSGMAKGMCEMTVEISSGLAKAMSAMTVEIEDRPNYNGRRVMVFPRKVNPPLPEGATLLPFSDEQWVAVAMN